MRARFPRGARGGPTPPLGSLARAPDAGDSPGASQHPPTRRDQMLSKARITILALTGAIAMTGVAEAKPTPKLTIKGPNGDFQGTIKAKKRKCMNNRAVHVF